MKRSGREGSAEPEVVPQRLVLNGRFLTRQLTGVDRVALELSRAIFDLLGDEHQFAVAVPANAPADAEICNRLGLSSATKIHRGRLTGYAWEQLELPMIKPEAVLLSFANMGPVLRRRQALMVHDAQAFDHPESYSAPFRLAYRLLQPTLARRVCCLLTVSNHSRGRLIANGLNPDDRALVVPNGVDHIDRVEKDPETLARFDLQPDGFFLAVGSKAAHKNLKLLVDLFARRPKTSRPLVVVGAVTNQVFASSDQLANSNVKFVGRVSDRVLKTLYSNARAFLFPSFTEGFGLPPLEAMCCRCPVIVSTGGAIPEVCGEAATYCDPTDQQAWLEAVEHADKAILISTQTVSLAQAHAASFTWEKSARSVLNALTQASQR